MLSFNQPSFTRAREHVCVWLSVVCLPISDDARRTKIIIVNNRLGFIYYNTDVYINAAGCNAACALFFMFVHQHTHTHKVLGVRACVHTTPSNQSLTRVLSTLSVRPVSSRVHERTSARD